MSDVNNAASSYTNDSFDDGKFNGISDAVYRGFFAGAAWQREQDAKLADAVVQEKFEDSYSGEMYTARRVATAIRAQGSKQETKPAWCVCDENHICGHAGCNVSSNQEGELKRAKCERVL